MFKTESALPCPSLPVMTELGTAPCVGTKQVCISQHKVQDVQSRIASGIVSQVHIAQPVTPDAKVPKQDFYSWLDKEIGMKDIVLSNR